MLEQELAVRNSQGVIKRTFENSGVLKINLKLFIMLCQDVILLLLSYLQRDLSFTIVFYWCC